MSENIVLTKCYNQDTEEPLCRQCMRSGESKDNEYETFDKRKTLMNGIKCNGYVSKRETELPFFKEEK